MFSEYCAQPFTVEPVEVVDAFGKTHGAYGCLPACLPARVWVGKEHLFLLAYQGAGAAGTKRGCMN